MCSVDSRIVFVSGGEVTRAEVRISLGIFGIFSFGEKHYFLIEFLSKMNVLSRIQGTCVFNSIILLSFWVYLIV